MNKSDKLNPHPQTKVTLRSPLTSQHSHSSGSLSQLSSSYVSSNYLRYLSHLRAEQPCQGEDDYRTYWEIVTKCILYLKRQYLNDDYHDELLQALLKPHFCMEKLDPTPRTDIGKELMRCGYFLAAYSLLLIRLRNSGKDLLDYFAATFSRYRVGFGEAELKWYLLESTYVQEVVRGREREERLGKESPCVRTSTCDSNRCW